MFHVDYIIIIILYTVHRVHWMVVGAGTYTYKSQTMVCDHYIDTFMHKMIA